jgi:GTP1/Obg family GTP-binding protein
MNDTVRVFGYQPCAHCQEPVLNEVAFKTGGRCADCYRRKLGPFFDEIIAVTKDRERIRLTLSKRSPAERAGRRRNKVRRGFEAKERSRLTMLARTRAYSRLTKIFPEIWEVLYADERAKLGMQPAWTIEKAVTPHRVDHKTMELLQTYHALEEVPNVDVDP